MPDEIILENPHLRLAIHPQKGTFTCEHKDAGVTWEPDPWQGTLGQMTFANPHGVTEQVSLSAARQVQTTVSAHDATLDLSDFKTRLDGIRPDRTLGSNLHVQVSFHVDSAAPRFTFRIEELEVSSAYWHLVKVVAPLRAFFVRTTRDDGYLLVPAGQGAIIPSRYERGYFRYLNWMWEEIAGYSRDLGNPSMPWYGVVKGNSGLCAILDTPYDAGMDVIANNVTSGSLPSEARSGEVTPGGSSNAPRLSAVSPTWQPSHGTLAYPRSVTFTFVEDPTPAKLAKLFREHAKKEGWFRSLRDKIAENPNVRKLLGGPDLKFFMATNRPLMPEQQGFHGPVYDGFHEISTSFQQLADIVDELPGLGIDRGMVHVSGWNALGYDNGRPMDTLPINEEAGGAEGLRQVAEHAKAAGLLLGIHDNYRNLDLNAPSYDESLIGVDADGMLQIGFSSEGGPSHQICSSNHLRLLQKTARYMAEIGANAYFLDTTTAVPLQECYDPDHPLTRQQDMENKRGLLAYLRSLGLVTGAESGKYWGAAEVDFFEGLVETGFGIPLPLFGLVFHDALITYWQHGRPLNYGYPRGDFCEKVLLGLLYGNSHNWVFASYTYPGWKRQLQELQALTAEFHRQVALEEMVDFRYHSADYLVRSSAFADGTQVAVNISPMDQEVTLGGQRITVPYRGFWIRYPDGRVVSGQIEYRVERAA